MFTPLLTLVAECEGVVDLKLFLERLDQEFLDRKLNVCLGHVFGLSVSAGVALYNHPLIHHY
jgi:hypothetical protein